MVQNELYTTDWVIEYIRSLYGEDFDNSSDEEKEAWVISEFKEIIYHDIDRLLTDKTIKEK